MQFASGPSVAHQVSQPLKTRLAHARLYSHEFAVPDPDFSVCSLGETNSNQVQLVLMEAQSKAARLEAELESLKKTMSEKQAKEEPPQLLTVDDLLAPFDRDQRPRRAQG